MKLMEQKQMDAVRVGEREDGLMREELELIRMIRESKDPARAMEIAVEIILANIPGAKGGVQAEH